MRLRLAITIVLTSAVLSAVAPSQCIPKPNSPKQESFSSLKQLEPKSQIDAVSGVVGIELLLEENAQRVLATLSDYDGAPPPAQTKLEGTIHDSPAGCVVDLVGHNKLGKVEIHGTIGVAEFRGVITRQIGKELVSYKTLLKRKPRQTNNDVG